MARPSLSDTRPSVRIGKRIVFVIAAFLSLSMMPSMTLAQFSGQDLLEPIVDDYGPKYSDFDTAIDQIRSGKASEARATLAALRSQNPNLGPANLMLAQVLFALKQVSIGQGALEDAVREDPTDPGTYAYMGEISFNGRRWAEAELLYKKSLDLAQNYTANDKRRNRLQVLAHNGLAKLADIQEDWATARSHWEQVMKLDPDNTIAMMRLGRVMFKMAKNRDDEREVFGIYKQLHADDSTSTVYPDVNMALLYEQSGKTPNAKLLMERAMTNDSQNPRTQLSVAKWAMEKGETELAEQAILNTLQLEPDSLDGQLYAAVIARSRKDWAAAETALKAAHLLSPTNLSAIIQLAQVLAESTDKRQQALALSYANLATRLYPDVKESTGREAAVTMAWVLSRLNQDAAAAQAIQQTLSGGGGKISPDSGYYAAQILYNSGLTESALSILTQTLSGESAFANRSAAEQLLAKIRNR